MMTFVAVFFFALFLGGVFSLSRRGFDREGRFQRSAKPLVWATLGAFVVWVWAIHRVPPVYPPEKTRFYIPPDAR